MSAEGQVLNRELVVVGAGISGLTLATEMQNKGWSVAVLDKARGSGGRLSSKRLMTDLGEAESVSFDLGCSDFSAQTPAFKERLQLWIAQGHVEHLHRDGQRRYTAVPRSSSLTRSLVDRVSARFQTRVTKISQVNGRWHCYETSSDNELSLVSVSDYLALAIPPEQASALLQDSNEKKARLESVDVAAQWVSMFILEDHIDLSFAKSELRKYGISRIQNESQKPGRVRIDGVNVWMIHMDYDWTQKHLSLEKHEVGELIAQALAKMSGKAIEPREVFCHRWLYSQVVEPLLTEGGTLELDSALFACGDWLVDEENIEAAQCEGVERGFLSAQNLVTALSQSILARGLKSA